MDCGMLHQFSELMATARIAFKRIIHKNKKHFELFLLIMGPKKKSSLYCILDTIDCHIRARQ